MPKSAYFGIQVCSELMKFLLALMKAADNRAKKGDQSGLNGNVVNSLKRSSHVSDVFAVECRMDSS